MVKSSSINRRSGIIEGRPHIRAGGCFATVQTAPMRQELEADGIFLPAKEMFVISETAGETVTF